MFKLLFALHIKHDAETWTNTTPQASNPATEACLRRKKKANECTHHHACDIDDLTSFEASLISVQGIYYAIFGYNSTIRVNINDLQQIQEASKTPKCHIGQRRWRSGLAHVEFTMASQTYTNKGLDISKPLHQN
jgi:hypothetical protein